MKIDDMKMDEMMDDEMIDDMSHDEKHKMMTMSDVSECLQKDFADEMKDAKKYLCMSKIANNANDEHDCHYLLEMAKDEYTHAVFIYDFMERHEIHISEEQEMCYNELKEEMAKFF